ncbi:MAG TPA: hypothetical protein VFF32_01925, partial [Dermatophilaceae bacterium]|nr:hypothetical protein [Dermatophilaceae bacterium]
MTAGRMNVLVMMLTAAAVLTWPHPFPISRVALRRVPADDDPFGDGSTGAGRSVDTSSSQTVVPAAEVAGVVDLLALTLRGGVGIVEAMEAVAGR